MPMAKEQILQIIVVDEKPAQENGEVSVAASAAGEEGNMTSMGIRRCTRKQTPQISGMRISAANCLRKSGALSFPPVTEAETAGFSSLRNTKNL